MALITAVRGLILQGSDQSGPDPAAYLSTCLTLNVLIVPLILMGLFICLKLSISLNVLLVWAQELNTLQDQALSELLSNITKIFTVATVTGTTFHSIHLATNLQYGETILNTERKKKTICMKSLT